MLIEQSGSPVMTDLKPCTSRTSLISMRVIRTLVNTVADAGVSETRFVHAAKLHSLGVRALDERVPRSMLYELIELALELTGDPALGLHSVERLRTDALDPLAGLVVHAATLQEALGSIQEFRRLLGEQASFRVCESHGKVLVQCDSLAGETSRVRRYMAEVVVTGLFRAIHRFRSDLAPEHVAFEYAAPEYADEYARVFERRARFDQPFTGLCFDRKLMAAAAPHPDAELHQALRVFATRRVRRLTSALPYAARVLDVLVWQRPPRDLSMQSVARTLGVSERSLRRRLRAEHKTYHGLVSEALATIAKDCLLDERRTIQETASELGFADNTSFHRAFKRWTGLTPAAYRRQQRAGSARLARVQDGV
jgi:AraC-like DNA-binding protein